MIILQIITALLVAVIFLSIFAKYHWFADGCRHFKTQYIFISAIILSLSVLSGALFLIFINLLIIAICVTKLQFTPHRKIHKNLDEKPIFKIIQFNKFFDNKNLDDIHEEITKSNADIVVLQEADNDFARKEKRINSQYNHMFTDANDHPYGLMIFSKYPFIEEQKFPIDNTYEKSDGYRIVIQPNGFKNPIALFSVHATNAFPKISWLQRNELLKSASHAIKKYDARHKIFVGDWNITPYSPFFKQVLNITGLNTAYNYLSPKPTWPNITFLPRFVAVIFQIPIDHILFSKDLIAVSKTIGKALGSDHHMLEMDFIEK